eukprot:UN03100
MDNTRWPKRFKAPFAFSTNFKKSSKKCSKVRERLFFQNKRYKMMCLQQTFLLNLELHATNVFESRSAGIHYHTNHTAHSMAHAPQISRCKSSQFNLQQNSTIMLILNDFHNKNKFQVTKKLADKNHEIHFFKYTSGSNVIGRVKYTNSSWVVIMTAIS